MAARNGGKGTEKVGILLCLPAPNRSLHTITMTLTAIFTPSTLDPLCSLFSLPHDELPAALAFRCVWFIPISPHFVILVLVPLGLLPVYRTVMGLVLMVLPVLMGLP